MLTMKPSKTRMMNRTNRRSNYQYIHTWPFRSKSNNNNNYFKPSTPTSLTFYDDFPRIFFEDQTEPAELLPYLYLGNECHASSKNLLLNLGITAVLNVSQSCPNHFEDEFFYKRIPISDSKCDDITIRINEALNFIGMYCINVFHLHTHSYKIIINDNNRLNEMRINVESS